MKLFDYSIKIKVALIAIFIILVVVLIFLINYNYSRGRDLKRVSQVREIATAMERYFDKTRTYPETAKINLSTINFISENGINQTGEYLYFKASNREIDGTLVSSLDRYVIEFPLDNSWDLWGVTSSDGGTCRLSNYLEMLCKSK
ncbi:MAG: hypothetical protein WCS88_01590 [Patescibacteria group bacterium]|jgi:type II secretory pathway pseudopilin PulG